jgi:group I intron endonuclease
MAKAGVYCINNLVNDKVYVGSSANLPKRRSAHFLDLKRGKHANEKLQRAWNKHGAECFAFIVLEVVDDVALLITREQHWIDRLVCVSDGYNIRPEAASNRGLVPSALARAKQSAALKGRKYSPEHCRNIGLAKKGVVASPETRAKIGAASAARTHSPETREKISKVTRGRVCKPMTEEHRANISAATIGKKKGPPSAEHRAKLSTAAQRRGISAEAQAKMQATRAKNRELRLLEPS